MFRRREDSLFDNEPNQFQSQESVGSSMNAQPSSSTTATSSTSSTPASAAPVSAPATSQPSSSQPPAYLSGTQSASRPSDARPTAAPASSFRPSSPTSSTADLSRSRMPEVKPAPVSSTPPSPASAFSLAGNKSSGKRVLTVGNDILLKGEIATCDRLVIEGKVDATLNDVHTVEISETGSFKGSAHIEDAEISGLFEGDLVVRNRLVIYATGKVRGKITYGEIEIERGGELTGEIKSSSPGSQTAAARTTRQVAPKDEKVAA